MNKPMSLAPLLLVWTCVAAWAAPVTPLPHGHAHNDYEHERPLFDALDAGMCSIEADIFLVEGKLLVAHDLEDVDPGRTLRGMYLDPLLARARENGGRIYPGGPTVILLVDIKDDGEKTYGRLREVLQDYREMLTVFTDASTEERAVTVIISGNRAQDLIWSETPRLAAVDGRLPDLVANPNPHRMPLVSSSWGFTFRWRGNGAMPEEQRDHLDMLVAKAHENGQRIRFWGLPRPRTLWPVLYAAGVDLLNADDLKGLRDFLLEQYESEAQTGEGE